MQACNIPLEEDTWPALQWFYNEFKRRRSEAVSEQDSDVLLIVEEVPAIMGAEDQNIPQLLASVVRKCGRESRGFGTYGRFITQQMWDHLAAQRDTYRDRAQGYAHR